MEDTEAKTDDNGVYIVIKNAGNPAEKTYRKPRQIRILSILHLVCGSVIFVLDILKIFFLPDSHANTLYGFCSSLFIMAGIIGFISMKKTTDCKISAFMVFSILSSIFGGFLFLSEIHLALFGNFRRNGFLLFFAFIGFIELNLGIVSSAFSCHACCGCCGASETSNESSVVYIAASEDNGAGNPRVVHLNMNEVRNKEASDHHVILDTETHLEDTVDKFEEDDSSKNGQYARFK